MSNDTTTQSAKHRINIPTPIMARGTGPLFVNTLSCVLVDIDDSLDSIFSYSDMAIGKYVAQRAGIGINAGQNQRDQQLESVAAKYNTQEWSPFLKKFESQLSGAALKTGSEVVQQLSTFLSGTKKSETSSSSKTTKEPKTTELES